MVALSILAPLPLLQTVSSAVRIVISAIAPPPAGKTLPLTQVSGANAPQRTQALRIKLLINETRDVPFNVAVASVVVVSPDVASAQIINSYSLRLTGLRVGETMLVTSDGRRHHTFIIAVDGRSAATLRSSAVPVEQAEGMLTGLSGSYALSYSQAFGGSALLRQSFELRSAIGQGRTFRFSGEMFKPVGGGDHDMTLATTPGFGLDRLSLGVDTPEGALDLLDSQLTVSPLSFNNYTMRGLHLVSTPGSWLRGIEFFAGLARPSLSLFDRAQGRLVGMVAPIAQGQSWRVRTGLFMVSTQQRDSRESRESGGTIWHLDGRYAAGRKIAAEGEAAYANGGLSWRLRLDLRRANFGAFGEVLRLNQRSPLISIGAQPGGRRTEDFGFHWRTKARFSASLRYTHTAIVPPASASRVTFDRLTLLASASYQFTRNSRFGFRFADQRIETGGRAGDPGFRLETRTATVSHQIRFNTAWANNLEARINFSREARADAGTESGFYFSDQLRYSWRGGSATGFINYTRRTPSLTGLIIRNPQLLPTPLQRAFAADPARFLQANRDTLAVLLPGVELPQTRSLEAGLRLQAAFSRVNVTGEMRYSAGEVLARNQRNLLTSFGAGVRLDAANSVQVSGWRSFGSNRAGGQSGLTVSYLHRFGAGNGGSFPFSKLLGLDRGQIQGRVFFDLNGNGQDDAGEPGVPDMRVQVDGDRSAKTDANGRFRFSSISSGEYSVALISAELGVRLKASTPTEQRVSLAARQTVNMSFGVSNFGTASGRVFNDLFLTGRPPDATTPGVSGVRLILRATGIGAVNGVMTAMVDADGSYEFRNLRPGSYMLELDPLTLPANFRPPAQIAWSINVNSLQGFYLDIPLAAQRAVSGIVFIDRDSDGQFDPQKDQVVEGARVTDGRVRAVSGAGGLYVLRNLSAGIMEIRAYAPGGVESRPFGIKLGAEPTVRRNINLAVTRSTAPD